MKTLKRIDEIKKKKNNKKLRKIRMKISKNNRLKFEKNAFAEILQKNSKVYIEKM